MNLRDLHYLLAIAESRNFKRAADICHVSQPTLSMQLKKLEEYLGVTLFERTNKSVLITETGRRIAETARRIVQDEQQIIKIAKMAHNPAAGEFKLGAMPTLASYVFPAYAPAIAKSFPGMQLLLVEDKTEILAERLKDGKIDAALLALPVEEAAFQSIKLFDDPFLLAVGQGHPLAKKKQVRLADLSGHKLLLLDEGHCLRDQALSVCHAHGAEEEQSFRATSLETLRLMVKAPESGFMTLMPKIATLSNDRLRYIPFTGPSPSRTIGLVCRKTSARFEVITEMARLMKNTLHD